MEFSPIKPGETLAFLLDFRVDGVNENFTDAGQLASQVRDKNGALVVACTVEAVGGVPGRFKVSATHTWPVGTLYCDVKRTQSGVVTYTDTFVIPVVPKVTA
jgi:hypothetical protein